MKLAKVVKRSGLVLLVLAGVLIARTFGGGSKQVEVDPGAASPPLVIDADAVAERLGEAIRFRTVSSRDVEAFDRAPFAALLDWFETSFPAVYTELRAERRADSSLLLHWPGSDPASPVGIFMAHLDVVPVEPGTEADWTYPPFDGVVANGHIWGRGALDVKSSAVALHEAITLLLTHDFQPERGIWFIFGHDEEIGGAEGALPIAKWMQERGQKVAFVVDEGGFVLDGVFPELGGRPLAMVDIAEKGYATGAYEGERGWRTFFGASKLDQCRPHGSGACKTREQPVSTGVQRSGACAV